MEWANQRHLGERQSQCRDPKTRYRMWSISENGYFLLSNVNLLSCRVSERERETRRGGGKERAREFLWFSFRCQSDFGADVLEQRVRVQILFQLTVLKRFSSRIPRLYSRLTPTIIKEQEKRERKEFPFVLILPGKPRSTFSMQTGSCCRA